MNPFLLQTKLEDTILEFFRSKKAEISEDGSIDAGYDCEVFSAYDLAVACEKVFDDYQLAEAPFKAPVGSWLTYVMLPSGWFPVRESLQDSKAASINEARRLYRNYVSQTVVVTE